MAGLTLREAQKRLTEHMRSRGLKVTRQREVILESFLKSGKHVGVEDLLRTVRRRSPSVGNATVYRTMKLFVEAGIAEERRFSTGATLYEPHDGDDLQIHLIYEIIPIPEEPDEPAKSNGSEGDDSLPFLSPMAVIALLAVSALVHNNRLNRTIRQVR